MKNILFILFCTIQFVTFSQSKMVWLNTADQLYEKEDYHNALIYYQKVLNDTTALSQPVLPYEVQLTNRALSRSEERRVGKECRARLSPYNERRKRYIVYYESG